MLVGTLLVGDWACYPVYVIEIPVYETIREEATNQGVTTVTIK